ncbi:hypothetical protein RB195_012445 [Necator americanus]|uniref:Uncharacterized protein n=1 Tax=Necator americanus TaxID=51031 RepID=A0ABR1D7T4_NECAM
MKTFEQHLIPGLVKKLPKFTVEAVEKLLKKKLLETDILFLIRVEDVDDKEYTIREMVKRSSRIAEIVIKMGKSNVSVGPIFHRVDVSGRWIQRDVQEFKCTMVIKADPTKTILENKQNNLRGRLHKPDCLLHVAHVVAVSSLDAVRDLCAQYTLGNYKLY